MQDLSLVEGKKHSKKRHVKKISWHINIGGIVSY